VRPQSAEQITIELQDAGMPERQADKVSQMMVGLQKDVIRRGDLEETLDGLLALMEQLKDLTKTLFSKYKAMRADIDGKLADIPTKQDLVILKLQMKSELLNRVYLAIGGATGALMWFIDWRITG